MSSDLRPSDTYGALGLTPAQFFRSIPDLDVRRFLSPGLLRVLDALFGGHIGGDDLRRVTAALVDFAQVLTDPIGRQRVLTLIPPHKQAELTGRVSRSIASHQADQWTGEEIGHLVDFFGLLEESAIAPSPVALDEVPPQYGLFDHQRTAVRDLRPLLTEFERRAVLHLPTGVGKTRTAMHVVAETLRQHEPAVVVWLASGKELLEQATDAFRTAWHHLGTRPVQLGAMWGKLEPDLAAFSDGFLAVGLAKAWALLHRRDPGWAARLAPNVRLVVFDEAHQSVARTYRRVTDELTVDYRCALLGLTATPGRTWADIDQDGALAQYYGENKVTLTVPGDSPIRFLTENGYLARPRFRTMFAQPGCHLTQTERNRIASALDIPNEVLARLTMSEQYVSAVLSAITDLLAEGHRRVLVFAATVDHARVLTALLSVQGVRAGVVTSATPIRQRNRYVARFRDRGGSSMVLVNFGVLTTGFDAPQASAVVIARPTTSLVLYSQMVGRGIRGPKAGGTNECTILTVVDPSLPGFGDVAQAFLNWEDVWQ